MANMKQQRLTVSRKTPVTIETPAGMIEIWSAGGKKLEIIMPPCMTANVGEDRSWASARWIEKRDGKVIPKFRILTPVIGPDGSLTGLDMPVVKRLAM